MSALVMPAADSTSTTCAYCGVGCGLVVSDKGLVADVHHPANHGRYCVKGSSLLDTVGMSQRLTDPMVDGEKASWSDALDQLANRMQAVIDAHGPDAVAFYVSGQLLTEDYYVANKLMKGYIGSANIDTNSRLCMSTAVAAHKRVFGSDTVPACYEDLECADLIVITGSNMAWTHPVIYQRIMAAKAQRPEMKLVVIDPRRTATAESADLHLQIAPGADAYLFDGLLAFLIQAAALDHDFISQHTRDFDAVAASCLARSGSLDTIASHCGVPVTQITTFYQWFADTAKTVTAFSQGINQSASGVDKAIAILHCHLATGRIGKPGASPFSITGQPNAMGGREVGGLANQLAAHMDIDNSEHRALVQTFWGSPRIAQKPGLKAVDMFDAVAAGKIRFVWIMATNPVVSMPDADKVRQALAACEHVVVSDCVADTDTLRLAHICLPAAGWGEKDGTVTNSERCISRQRAFLPCQGQIRPDWWIICQVAARLGFKPDFDYCGPADIFREHAALSGFHNNGARDFDISGLATLSNDDYHALTPVQWPVTTSNRAGTNRLFGDGRFFTSDHKARFVPTASSGSAVASDQSWPFIMNTGRIRDQWHTMTRTGRSSKLQQHRPEPFVEIHPDDMNAMGIQDHQLVTVSSTLGRCHLRALSNNGQSRGSVFVPIHWNDCFTGAGRVDALVAALCDPVSGQPAFKQTPVAIEALATDWQAVLISRKRLLLPANVYWTTRELDGWYVTRMAGTGKFNSEIIKRQLMRQPTVFAGIDDSAGIEQRLIAISDNRVDCCVYVHSGSGALVVDEPWLLEQLQENTAEFRVLAQGRALTGNRAGALVCTCHQVREAVIVSAIQSGAASAEDIGRCTRAGTQCGSCVPELRRLLQTTPVVVLELPPC